MGNRMRIIFSRKVFYFFLRNSMGYKSKSFQFFIHSLSYILFIVGFLDSRTYQGYGIILYDFHTIIYFFLSDSHLRSKIDTSNICSISVIFSSSIDKNTVSWLNLSIMSGIMKRTGIWTTCDNSRIRLCEMV